MLSYKRVLFMRGYMRRLRLNLSFFGGLRTKIQDIVDYKEYNTVNRLLQLATLA
jgi:hypothetical protein